MQSRFEVLNKPIRHQCNVFYSYLMTSVILNKFFVFYWNHIVKLTSLLHCVKVIVQLLYNQTSKQHFAFTGHGVLMLTNDLLADKLQ
jgi:hypothetical protein